MEDFSEVHLCAAIVNFWVSLVWYMYLILVMPLEVLIFKKLEVFLLKIQKSMRRF